MCSNVYFTTGCVQIIKIYYCSYASFFIIKAKTVYIYNVFFLCVFAHQDFTLREFYYISVLSLLIRNLYTYIYIYIYIYYIFARCGYE